MSTAYHNLSEFDSSTLPDASDMRFGIVVSEWNDNITLPLLNGVVQALTENGVPENQIFIQTVPGSFELTYGAAQMAKNLDVDAVIAIGCVVRGETPHFDYICQGVTNGISYLNATGNVPVIFSLLTTNDMQQAIDRSGGKYGNKGTEGAITAIKMVQMRRNLK